MNTIDRILDLLEKKGIQQKDLAKEIGLGENNISEWKAGRSKSYIKYIYQIAEFLDTSPLYLLCKTDDPTPPTIIDYKSSSIDTGKKNRSADTERDMLMHEFIKSLMAEKNIEILKEVKRYSDYIIEQHNRDKQ